MLFYSKRSCSRFAALTLRLRTEMPLRDIPVFRSAYFTQRVHSTLCSKTLDLQVRFAHPTDTGEPKLRVFMPPLCKGRCRTDEGRLTEGLLLAREITLETTTPQSACGGRLPPAHRNDPSGHSGVTVGLFSAKSTQYSLLQNARPPGSLRSPYG